MSELQGAVAVAQLPKLGTVVEQRMTMASKLTEQLRDLPGVETPVIKPQSVHVYWKYCLRIDERLVPGGAIALARLLREKGISSAPRYIQKPAFMCEVFAEQRTFGKSHYPFTLARPEVVNYERRRFPGTFKALEDILVLPWNERYSEEHVSYIADSIRQAVAVLRERGM
jgi:dTDP-4-amino-4,6-dideoxygalactose transaminase